MAKLRVGVFEQDPDALGCFRNLPKAACDKPGAEVEIFSVIMTILGLDYELVDIMQQYGTGPDYGSDNGNGSWSGMIGLLMNGSIDLTALTIRMTPERAAVIDFAFPVRYYQTVYIFERPDEFDFRNFIFNAFTTEVWVIFLLCVAAANAVHFVCVLLLLPHHHTWMYRAEYAFNMMMDERERYWCCSLLTKMYIFSALVMSEYYQSVMATNLTAPSRAKMPFLTQNQLIVLLDEGKCHLTYFVNTPPPCANDENCQSLKDALAKNPLIVHPDSTSLFNDLWYHSGVYFGSYDIDFLPNVASRYDDANLTIIRDTSSPMYYVSFGFATSQKRLRQRFNEALMTMLMAVPEIKTRPGYYTVKDAEDGSYRAQSGALTLQQHMEQLFIWWAVSIGGVLLCFVIELLWFFRARLALVQRTISVWQSRFGFGRLLERPAKEEEELVSAPLDNGFAPFPPSDDWWMSDEANNRAVIVPVRRRSTRIDENLSFFTYPSNVSS